MRDNKFISDNDIKEVTTANIMRADYNSSQYYKDYEEVVRDYVDKYLARKRQAPPSQTNK